LASDAMAERPEARQAAAAARATVSTAADVVRVALPRGPRVLVLRDRAAPAVSIVALWSGGVRFEDARTNGATTLLAALLPRATRTRDARRLAADLADVGGTLVGVAGRDELGLRLEVLAGNWERGLELVADCALHPALADDDVDRARRDAIDRARLREDDATTAAGRLFAETLFAGHPYRLPVGGTADSLSGLSRGRLAEHYRRLYGASNLTIAIVGDVDVERAVARVAALFADAPAIGQAPATKPITVVSPSVVAAPSQEPPPPPASTEVFRLAAHDDAHIVLGFPGVALADPDRPAVELLARVLGGPLARAVGAADVVATTWSAVDGGAFAIDLDGAAGGLDATVPLAREALARAVSEGVTQAALDRARRDAVAAHARGLERRADVALALARDEAFGLSPGATRARPAAFAAVTPAVLSLVARRLFDPAHEIVAAVRPPAPAAVAKADAKRPAAAPRAPSSPSASGGRRAPAP
ncbi:MAG TPA: pitrilysin family protein, partial [Polyangia bacterium]|nr:pitrilysin family protein [Polyangia bacterium]